MFIIPIQNKPDWSRPPLATIALILINLLVFLFYQGQDDNKEQIAIATYQRLELAKIEQPHYEQLPATGAARALPALAGR